MNRDCEGDVYEVNGQTFYRCFWDSTVVDGEHEVCPVCKRKVARRTKTKPEVRLVTKVQVYSDVSRRWFTHKTEIQGLTQSLVPKT